MSYDIYLRGVVCDKCGREGEQPQSLDPTYNLTPIFDLALTGEGLPNPTVSEGEVVLFGKETDRPRGLRLLSGRVARDTVADIDAALARLTNADLRERFKALEPDNGWGDLDAAVRVMKKMREYAESYPFNTWDIH
jgi:hypothetical protein